jgi:hypothetical protein
MEAAGLLSLDAPGIAGLVPAISVPMTFHCILPG